MVQAAHGGRTYTRDGMLHFITSQQRESLLTSVSQWMRHTNTPLFIQL